MRSADYKKRMISFALALLFAGSVSNGSAHADYIPTNRDTKLPPDKVLYDRIDMDEFTKIYETDTLVYYYREDRDVFAVRDKRNGYTWKTGLDIPFGSDIKNDVMAAETSEEAEALAKPIEANMNTTFTGISNSVLTLEYNEKGTVKSISSAAGGSVESELIMLNDDPAKRRLDVNFRDLGVEIKVGITLEEDSIHYEIRDEDITGKGMKDVVALQLTPFLGASGGADLLYNPETQSYDTEKKKYMVPGYIFVPDGSGSLIRFVENDAKFSMYFGDVYGEDWSQYPTNNTSLSDVIPMKNPVMPVFGAAHGDGQAAFVAYADKGAEYMQIAVRPEGNMTYYNQVYPRFVKNTNYFQVYNKKGDGFYKLMDVPNRLDIDMTYTFLAGNGEDGTPAADYTGMARTYREHLLETGVLTEKESGSGDIPLRLDFMMSDVKKSIVGTEEVVITDTEGVRSILNTVLDSGITNVNSGLYGWQKGGETLSAPGKEKYSGKVGTKRDFKELITEFADKGIDISYARDYTTINKKMLSYKNNAVKHVNSWYLNVDKKEVLPNNSPVTDYSFAAPEKSAEWFRTQAEQAAEYSRSLTAGGITNVLLSNYNSDGVESSTADVIALYQNTMQEANADLKLNLEAPNMYLWKYTDRYLKTPVGTSQYVFETDAVPFLQMVLHGTMEVYAPYANFSFYTQTDILRMIDYNLSPSFILSEKPSYHLAATPSADLYSTEFIQYESLIQDVYGQINEVMKQVNGYEWTERVVLENGVIKNIYRSGDNLKSVIINYSEEQVRYEDCDVAPLSAAVITEKGVQ